MGSWSDFRRGEVEALTNEGNLMADTGDTLPQWVSIIVGVGTSMVVGVGVLIKVAFNTNTRLLALENALKALAERDHRGTVRDELEKERHDILYPQLQVRVYAVIDKLEEEIKMQGQNIAVLMERDRTAAAFERLVPDMAKAVATAVTEALRDQAR